jgi:amino acid permease
MMGTSMLSMAWGLQQSGFAVGIFLMIFFGFITFYTANRVLRSQYHVPRNVHVFEFPDICRVFLGTHAEIIAGIFGLLSFFGALLAYWTLMSTFLFNIGEFIHLQVRILKNIFVLQFSLSYWYKFLVVFCELLLIVLKVKESIIAKKIFSTTRLKLLWFLR